jgi:hypothetical protein
LEHVVGGRGKEQENRASVKNVDMRQLNRGMARAVCGT